VKVSVIVSTYTKDRHSDVLQCLNSLFNQTRKPSEIILVLDPVDDLIEFYSGVVPDGVKIVASSGFGLSNARNTGIENSSGDFIAFIDDDAWADERWLENLLKNFGEEKVWVAGGKIVPVFDKGRPRWLAEELNWIVGCTYRGMPEKRAEVRNPIGANMAFRREVFEVAGKFRTEVGRYGKKLLGSEEAELCLRLKKLRPDAKIIYDPSAVVYHRAPESRAKLRYALKRAYYEGYSKAILGGEHELGEEKDYLNYLLIVAVPRKIKKMQILQALAILMTIFAVGLGNFVVKLRRNKFEGH